MPTVALINGHAFAAGLMTAMMQDYRIMNPHKGFACLNELDFGAPLPPAMASIFRQKLPRPAAYRSMVLESRRFGALEALNEGIVDGVGGMAEVEALIRDRRLVGRADGGSYGQLKEEMWRETVRHMDKSVREDEADAAARAETASLLQAGAAARVAAWESKSRVGKTKL
jgi:enoyl-CoA hydratase/carnithine racemase